MAWYQFSSTSLVLENPDLLQNIFEYFDLCNLRCITAPDHFSMERSTRQSLLWASLTSRAFLDPGMNILWREMESILPLYRVLPTLRKVEEDSDEETSKSDEETDDPDEEDSESESEYTYTEPLNGNDVQRILFYARRIRSLHFHDDPDHLNIHLDLSMDFFMRINELNAFLSLREMTVSSGLDKFQFTTLRRISPPNLETLSLLQVAVSPQEDRATNSFLEALARKSPRIKTLLVEGNHTNLSFAVVPKFSNVQDLTLYFQNASAISLDLLEQVASSMGSLQSLEMDFDASEIKSDPSRHGFQFISLTKLVVSGRLHSVKKVLEVVHAPLLCCLSLAVEVTPGFDSWTSFRSFIPVEMIDKPEPVDLNSQIAPFIIFDQLVALSICVQTLRISTTHLAKFLHNNRYLSNLLQLRLDYDRPPEINQSLSIAALPLIASACPELVYLAIAIYHPDQSEMQITTRSGRSHNLQTLRFNSLPDWDDSTSLATALSSFLNHLFPRLTNTYYDSRKGPASAESHEKWWDDVEDMIKVHQTRRIRSESD